MSEKFCKKHRDLYRGFRCPECENEKSPVMKIILVSIPIFLIVFGVVFFDLDEKITDSIPQITNPQKTSNFENNGNLIIKKIQSTQTRELDVDKLRQEIHELINIERKKAGVKPLILDSKINGIAQEYAEYMAKNNHFAHKDVNGNNIKNRFIQSNYNCLGWMGENIAMPSHLIGEELGVETINAWMESKGHKENMINVNYKNHGLGIAVDTNLNSNVYIVNDFC